ncbi:MAG: hypothetical protein EAX91_07555 [Candidatus Lokiarchaeota archaeon]|nr:hypothetical protein [Candidatus Lokiarchaeota archaeon]
MVDIEWNNFRNPPKSSRPMVRWWWTGLDVEKDELIKEFQELDEKGFLGAEIQVFMIGSPMNLERIDIERAKRSHRFMQPYYYEMIKILLDEAAKRDMILDLTISSSWPTGGVHIDKKDSMKTLMIGQRVLEGPLTYSDKIPEMVIPAKQGLAAIVDYRNERKLVALIAAKPTGKPGKIKFRNIKTSYLDKSSIIDLTDKVDKDGILNWEVPNGTWQLFSFFSCPSGVMPLSDSRSEFNKTSLVIDHLASDPIRRHLDLHLGEGKKYFGEHFGKSLRGFFTDSLELASNWLWTEDFLKKFKQKRGYDIRPFLPVCFVPNRDNKYQHGRHELIPVYDFMGGIGEKIRYDYELTISDLFSEELVQTMTDWAEENNLKNRIQGYGLRADTLKIYGISHIPETEQLFAGGIIDFLKFAGSAGTIYGKSIITAESMVWNQRDYMTTPLKWKVTADRLFSSGVNQMIYHGYPYQNPLFPYPGFCGFSTPYLPAPWNFSSNFSRSNPFWDFFPIINEYISRCQYVLQHGRTVSKVAIYYSIFNYCDDILKKEELVGGYLDEYDAPLSQGAINAHVKKADKLDYNERWTSSFLKITDELNSFGYYYTHLNEESILNSTLRDNKLIIRETEFETLIMPNIDKISFELAKKVKEIANSGIPIIFINSIPLEQPGYLNYEKNDKEIKKLIEELLEAQKIYLINNVNEISSFILNKLEVKPGLCFDEPETSIHYIHKKTTNSDYYFLRNSQNYPKKAHIKFSHPDKIPFILNPWNGEIFQAPQYKRDKMYLEIDLFFQAYDSIIIEFKKADEEIHVIESPIMIERYNKKLVSYIDKVGQFDIKLSNQSLNTKNINENDLLSIPIQHFNFKTKIRDYLGNLKLIEMEMGELKDWREIPELKYCSSKGTYLFKFDLNKEISIDDHCVIISIEHVHDVAVVKVNGTEFSPLLVYPFTQEITSSVKFGENTVEIDVTPTLRNRLIGYGRQGGENWINHKNKKEFMPSGLIGPIFIKIVKKVVFL